MPCYVYSRLTLTSQLKNSSYLIDLLENFALERGVYGKRWLDEDILMLSSLTRWA